MEATFRLCPPQLLEYLGATDIQLVSHSIYRLSSTFDVNRSVVESGVAPLVNNCLFGTWTKREKQIFSANRK